MLSLIGFELKKIISRKSTYITALAVIAMMIGIYFLNIYGQQYYDRNLDAVSGFDAIAAKKVDTEALAGPITNERATDEFRAYRDFFQGEGELKDEYAGEDERALQFDTYDIQHQYFMQTFLSPWMNGFENARYVIWRVDTAGEVDLYGAIEASLERQLDNNMAGTWEYSDAERSFWLSKYQETAQPIEYGYADGWMNIFDCFDFILLIYIAICVGVTPIFSSEYREKTDAVILSTRNGKSKLPAAKVLAGLLFASGMMVIGLVIAIGLPLLFYGADGAELPIQLVNLTIPYNLTMIQATALCSGIAFLVALGLTAFMLLLSAKWKSTIGIVMVGVAVVMLPMLLPVMKHGVAAHLGVLLPSMTLSFSNLFSMLLSYPIGPVAVDALTVIAVVYVVIIAISIPLAMRGFKRHQVA